MFGVRYLFARFPAALQAERYGKEAGCHIFSGNVRSTGE